MLPVGTPAAESCKYDAMTLDGEHGEITTSVHLAVVLHSLRNSCTSEEMGTGNYGPRGRGGMPTPTVGGCGRAERRLNDTEMVRRK